MVRQGVEVCGTRATFDFVMDATFGEERVEDVLAGLKDRAADREVKVSRGPRPMRREEREKGKGVRVRVSIG